MAHRIEGSMQVTGRLTPQFLDVPAETITNAMVSSSAAITAAKLQHQHQVCHGQPNTAAADETRVLHVVRGAIGEALSFVAGSIAKAIDNAICTVDLKKNGASILSSVITLDSANTNRVAGDVLEVVIDGTIGTGTLPTGVFCSLTLREAAD